MISRLCLLLLRFGIALMLELWQKIELIDGVHGQERQECGPKVDHCCRCGVGELSLAKLENNKDLRRNAAD